MTNALGPDVSFYDDDPDTPQQVNFEIMASRGVSFVGIKIGQSVWPDRTFAYNWSEAKRVGLPRLGYWFYDSRTDPIIQADLCLNLLGDDQGELPIHADFEDTYEGDFDGPIYWKAFMERLKSKTSHELGIYTAYYYWKDRTNLTDQIYFSQYPLWVANYDVSSPLLPPGWDEWLFWQFTNKGDGHYYGSEASEIDLNYFNGDEAAFRQRFGLSTGDQKESWFGGTAQYTKGYRETPRPFQFHVTRFKRSDVLKVTIPGYNFLGRCTTFWKNYGQPQIATNGGEGYYEKVPVLPKSIGLADGNYFKNTTEQNSIQWDQNGNLLGIFWNKQTDAWNAIGISHILVENGVVPDNLDNTSIDPRTVLGWNDEEYILVHIDGRNVRDPDGNLMYGLGMKETGEFLKSLGAMEAGNLDGGDSCTLVQNDDGVPVIRNVLPDNTEHSVVNHIGFSVREIIDGGNMWSYDVINEVGVRSYSSAQPGHTPPSMYSTSIGTATVGHYETIKPPFDNDGVSWIDFKGNGAIPISWQNKVYVTNIKDESNPPPTTGAPARVVIEQPDGSTWEATEFVQIS